MIELLPDADSTYRRLVERLRAARTSVDVRMFVWRSDAIGNEIAREVLAAADRGVRVRIFKDVSAFLYERIEMNRKSLFNRPVSAMTRLWHRFSAWGVPDTHVEDAYDASLGDALQAHRNVAVEWVSHTHTKCWEFDEDALMLGSINLEDRHRGYCDYMVEIRGPEHIARLRERYEGRAPIDPGREIEFIHNRPGRFEIKPQVLAMLSEARRSAYVEMAYLGDPEVTEALVAAAKRGVEVTFLFSREANVGNDLNYRTMHRIARRATVRTFLTPRMVHAKLLMTDDDTVLMGSANLSVFSLQKAQEMDVRVRSGPFASAVRAEAARRIEASEPVTDPERLGRYSRIVSALQQIHQWVT